MAIQRKESKYSEADLVDLFGLKKFSGNSKMALMSEWTKAETSLDSYETQLFGINGFILSSSSH